MNTKEIVHITEEKMRKSLESLQREFMEVRTGRAHPGLIEGMHVDYYGAPTLLKQMASISIPDPRSMVIQPWDVSALPEIERAINNSKLGVSAVNDGKIVRIVFPQLSEERRKELAKVVKDMAENGRISVRTIRRESNEKIKKLQTESAITEDDSFKGQEHIQKLTDKVIKDIDALLNEKSRELTEFK